MLQFFKSRDHLKKNRNTIVQARRNVRPQSCQSAFSSFSGVAGRQRFIFIFLGELVGIRLYPRCCRGSVIYNSLICPQDLWSRSFGNPPSDMSQDYNLIAASESDGSTVVEFSRDAVTGDKAKDVQFMVRSF